jgi:hypothetical protein
MTNGLQYTSPASGQGPRQPDFLPPGKHHLESDTMNQTAFTKDLTTELRLRGTSYEPGALAVFVADAWSLIESDPAVSRWASQFSEQLAEIHDGCGGVDDK